MQNPSSTIMAFSVLPSRSLLIVRSEMRERKGLYLVWQFLQSYNSEAVHQHRCHHLRCDQETIMFLTLRHSYDCEKSIDLLDILKQ